MSAQDPTPEQLGIIGRERTMVDKVVKTLHAAARPLGDYTAIREDRRGSHFELRLADNSIVSVTVTFERIEGND